MSPLLETPFLAELRHMKNTALPIVLLAAIVAGTMASCDRLEDPVLDILEAIPEEYEIPELPPILADNQRILVEEFTGHTCGNCPPAALEIDSMVADYGATIVPLAIHAGNLAFPTSDYPTDFTTNEGDEYWDDLDNPNNPRGRFNRFENEGFSLAYTEQNWNSKLSELLDGDATVGMQVESNSTFDPDKVFIHVQMTWFSDLLGEYKLAILVAENNIIAPQTWYDTVDPPGPPNEVVYDYVHKHVLRGSVTGAKGEVVATDPSQGDAAQFDYVFTWNDEWIKENCDVIAVLTEVETGRVVQVTSIHIVE